MNRRRIIPAVAALLTAATLVTGCGDSGHHQGASPSSITLPTTSESSGPGMQAGPQTQPTGSCQDTSCPADNVVVSGLTTLFSYRPGVDPDPTTAAADRAVKYLAPAYMQAAAGTWSMIPPVTGNQWATWAQGHVPVTASVQLLVDEHPADTGTQAWRVAQVTLNAPGSTPTTFTVWVALGRGGPYGWQIVSINTNG